MEVLLKHSYLWLVFWIVTPRVGSEISGFYGHEYEYDCLLECYDMYSSRYWPTFQKKLLPPLSRLVNEVSEDNRPTACISAVVTLSALPLEHKISPDSITCVNVVFPYNEMPVCLETFSIKRIILLLPFLDAMGLRHWRSYRGLGPERNRRAGSIPHFLSVSMDGLRPVPGRPEEAHNTL